MNGSAMFNSIRSKLIGGFSAIVVMFSVGSAVTLALSQRMAGTVGDLINNDLSLLVVKDAAGDTISNIKLQLKNTLASDAIDQNGELLLRGHVDLAKAYIEEMRLGSESGEFAASKYAAILDAEKKSPRMARPAEGNAFAAVSRLQSTLPEFEAALGNALEAHRERLSNIASIEGRSWELPSYAYMLKSAHAKWVSILEESIRFETRFTGNLDPGKSPSALLLASYKSTNPKIADGLSKLAQVHEKVYQAAQQIEAAASSDKKAIFDKQRTLAFQRMNAVVDQIIEVSEKALQDAATREALALTNLDKAVASMSAAFSDVDMQAHDSFTEGHQAVLSANSLSVISTSVIIALALMLCGIVTWLLTRQIAHPITAMAKDMGILASGGTDLIVVGLNRQDEIGAMAKALQSFKESAIERDRIRREIDANRVVLDGIRETMDTERESADKRRTAELRRMVEQVESETRDAVEAVVSFMDDMTHITARMSSTASELSENSEAVAAAAHQTQSTMQNAKKATDRLAKSIDEIADRVRQTNDVANDAVNSSRLTQDSIDSLSQVVAEIDSVTRLITDIARQTNLLAINAGVEATRSGQDGKGFAVIAQEVKSLSEQTSSATSKISNLVRQIHDSTGHAVQSVRAIAGSIGSVSDAARQMSNAIAQQVTTTREIAAGISETATANSEVTDRMQNIASEAGSTGQQAQDVDQMCSEVAEQVRELQASLVRIVRTCSTEIDRRQATRHEVCFSASVGMGAHRDRCDVRDISEGGARISGSYPFRSDVVLHLPDFAYPLTGRVVGQLEDETRLQFVIKEDVQKALSTYIMTINKSVLRQAA